MNRLFDYLSRIGKSRGFGIQSPWAYSFVRNVIMGEGRSSAIYAERLHDASRFQIKKQQLVDRLQSYTNGRPLTFADACNSSLADVLSICSRLANGDILVLENIHNSKDAYAKWISVKEDASVGITFDLYYLAICFPPDKKYKQHYRLNYWNLFRN